MSPSGYSFTPTLTASSVTSSFTPTPSDANRPPALPFQRLVVFLSQADRGTFTLQIERDPQYVSAAVHYQQAFTGAPFGGVTVGSAECESLGNSGPMACMGLSDCNPTPGQSLLQEHRGADPRYVTLVVTLKRPALSNPLCPSAAGVITAAVVQANAALVTVPVYRLAAILMQSEKPERLEPAQLLLNATVFGSSGAVSPAHFVLDSLKEPFDTTSVPLLSRSSDRVAVHCSIPDVGSFARSEVNVSDDLSLLFRQDCSYAAGALTGIDLVAMCARAEQCVGVTTTSSGAPLCLLSTGRSADPHYGLSGRWLMQKPSEEQRACVATLANSGIVTVLVQQTSLAANTFAVFNGEALVAQCGGSWPFAGGAFGRTSACDVWMVCYEGRTLARDTLRVVVSATTTGGGCESGAVGVVFSTVFDSNDATRAPEPALPALLTVRALRHAFPHRAFIRNSRRAFVHVFVLRAQQVVLAVAQTGFDCARTQGGSCTGGSAVELAVGSTVLLTCGGASPFLGGVAGASDQCLRPRFCGMPASLPSGSTGTAPTVTPTSSNSSNGEDDWSDFFTDDGPFVASSGALANSSALAADGFTGWIRLNVDIASIRSASSLCPHFAATIFASPAVAPGDGFSGFVLRAGGGAFALVAAPADGSLAGIASRGWADAFPLSALASTLNPDDARRLLVVNISTYADRVAAAGDGITSFACIMDWISGDAGTCTVAVPAGANFVEIRVAQTAFAPESGNKVAVLQFGRMSVTHPVEKVVCGSSLGFSGLPSRSEQCRTFLPCSSGFLDPEATTIRIEVPSSVGSSQTCTVAFAATIDFRFENATVPQGAACPFLCVRDRKCISQSAVCNGIVECADGSDEAPCMAWSKIETNYIFTVSAVEGGDVVIDVDSYSACREAALRTNTRLFALSHNQTICIAYGPAHALQLLSNPTPFLDEVRGFSIFARLDKDGGVIYGRCSPEGSCSGNGQVIETRVAGKLSCACVCRSGFTERDCSKTLELAAAGPVAVTFNTPNISVTTTQIEQALRANATDVTVSCSAFSRHNNKLTTMCKMDGPAEDVAAMRSRVTSDAGRRLMAAALNVSESALEPIAPSTQPIFQDAVCSVDEVTSSTACEVGGKAVGNVRVTVTATGNVDDIVVRMAGAQRRSVGSDEVAFRCSKANVSQASTKSGCMAGVCFVRLDTVASVNSLTVSTPFIAANVSTDPCFSVQVEFTVPILITDARADVPVRKDGDFSAFLITGAVLIATGTAILVAASAALYRFSRETLEAAGAVAGSASSLEALLTTTVRRMKFEQRRKLRWAERWSTGLVLMSLVMLVLGIFLTLYFANSYEYSSNMAVLLESYRTESCEDSLFSPLAMRVTRVPAANALQCAPRESTGASGSVLYSAAFCDNSTGALSVVAKVGLSLGECNAQPFSAYPLNSCVSVASVLPRVNDSTYLLFKCGTVSSVDARFAAFQTLNADTSDKEVTRPRPTPDALRQPTVRLVPSNESGRPIFVASRVGQGAVATATSTADRRYETAAGGGALVAGDSIPRRLVVQVRSDVYSETAMSASTKAIEGTVTSVKHVSDDVSQLGPRDGDYPVGFIFNNFDIPGEATLHAAGAGAARYFGARGSAADVGLDASNGMTITMYLRCSRLTSGFAFAVADAREDLSSGTSPLLSRLMTMLANRSPGSAWYNGTYNVYSSLFIDGPAAALHFVFANPVEPGVDPSSSVVDVEWDMTSLGLMRLFNGVWHHVAIIIRGENMQTKAQLVVDGVTSDSQKGWNHCLPRLPDAIQLLQTERDVGVRNLQSERVLNDGVLYTGYLNGGVAHLEFIPDTLDVFELWRSSTEAIREHNALDMIRYIVLGSVLLAVGVLMLVGMLATSGVEWMQSEAVIRADEAQQSQELYTQLWSKGPRDTHHTAYTPVLWTVAVATMQMDVQTFTIFLEELQLNFRHPSEELVRLLYAKAMSGSSFDKSAPAPTADEWQYFVEEHLDVAAGDLSAAPEEFVPEEMEGVSPDERFDMTLVSSFADDPGALEGTQSRSISRVQSIHDLLVRRSTTRSKRKVKLTLNLQRPVMGRGKTGQHVGPRQFRDGRRSRQQNSTKSKSSPSEIIQTVLSVIQSVSVWQTTIPFPRAHLAFFHVAFSVFSLDFTVLFQVTPLVTPLVQLFVVMVLCGVLLFVVEEDEKVFAWNLARYVVIRDTVDGGHASFEATKEHVDYMSSEIDAEFGSLMGEPEGNGVVFSLPVLPLSQAQKIDDFVANGSQRMIVVHDSERHNYTLEKPPGVPGTCNVEQLDVTSEDAAAVPLRHVGYHCALHTNRLLGQQDQTFVWPYDYRPTCCVETIHGHRCNETVGRIFMCGAKEERDGKPVQCKYSICEKHFHPPLWVSLRIGLVTAYRSATDRGLMWLVVTLFLIAANAFYTPFMKTAVMILSCHPSYQCQLPQCWEAPDRLFVLAAFLCLAIVLFYGIGFPLAMTILLQRRKQMLCTVFFSDVYEGRYEDPAKAGVLDIEEWRRYVVTDSTALGSLYLSFELEWIYVPPVLLFWKAVVLAPAVFLERGSFQQIVGVAAAQFLFGVFTFVTEPSVSPVIDLMYKLGVAHQMLLLGTVALDTRQRYAGEVELGLLGVGITLTYLFICVGVVVVVAAMPDRSIFQRQRLVKLLDSLGMHYSVNTGMYIVPCDRELFATGIHDDATGSLVSPQLEPTSPLDDSSAYASPRSVRIQTVVSSVFESVAEDEVAEFFSDDDKDDGEKQRNDDQKIQVNNLLLHGFVDATGAHEVNPLQKRILLSVQLGSDCLVIAPAGTGKSTAASIVALQTVDLATDAMQVIVLCRDGDCARATVQRMLTLGSMMSGGAEFTMLLDGRSRSFVEAHVMQLNPKAAKIVVATVENFWRIRDTLRTEHTICLIVDDADDLFALSDAVAGEEAIARVDAVSQLLPCVAPRVILARDKTPGVVAAAQTLLRRPVEITT
jgi:hypothetical protein